MAEGNSGAEERVRKLSAPIGFEALHIRATYGQLKQAALEMIPPTEEYRQNLQIFRLTSVDVVDEIHQPRQEILSLTEMKDLNIHRIPDSPPVKEGTLLTGFNIGTDLEANILETKPCLANGQKKEAKKDYIRKIKWIYLWDKICKTVLVLFLILCAYRLMTLSYRSTSSDLLDVEYQESSVDSKALNSTEELILRKYLIFMKLHINKSLISRQV
ncbi:hypothetical protein QYM36_004820 [Artemia franciscana]|uniref:Uncharacterized protein n=1 Tax=Artemia franciscana TaxID=6661 RepID=A0AA88I1A1_ARTSF|nr:hypothetical protein QYM36_004820 [Artemia franciscana]